MNCNKNAKITWCLFALFSRLTWAGISTKAMTHQKHQIKGKTCSNWNHSFVQHVCTHNTCMQTAHNVTKQSKTNWERFIFPKFAVFKLIPLLHFKLFFSETTKQLLPLLMCEATLRIHRVRLHHWKKSLLTPAHSSCQSTNSHTKLCKNTRELSTFMGTEMTKWMNFLEISQEFSSGQCTQDVFLNRLFCVGLKLCSWIHLTIYKSYFH